ncbi:hypothetical protein An07g04380 [Aspergillus niger]|uniref:Uncharacterized protein n=2 Tax=Aspergillus niger TaxID=5061 RepID=A2QN47_ASPNC|nr:hypothetical protein An07g04380 [Aspergillus niger]CAK48188.1 hypothetical protein An07g04380 [Aspergillus niger]
MRLALAATVSGNVENRGNHMRDAKLSNDYTRGKSYCLVTGAKFCTNLQAAVGGALVEEISPGPMKSWSQLSAAVEQLAQTFSSSRSSSQSIVQEIKCLIGSGSDQKQDLLYRRICTLLRSSGRFIEKTK